MPETESLEQAFWLGEQKLGLVSCMEETIVWVLIKATVGGLGSTLLPLGENEKNSSLVSKHYIY